MRIIMYNIHDIFTSFPTVDGFNVGDDVADDVGDDVPRLNIF